MHHKIQLRPNQTIPEQLNCWPNEINWKCIITRSFNFEFFFMTSTITVDHFLTLTPTTAPTTAAERFCLFILMLPVCWFTYVGSFWLWWHLHRNLQRNCRKLPHHNLDGSADTGPWLDRSCQVWIDPGCHGNRRAGRSSLARWAGRGIRWNI